jgi:peptidoglycan/xylan/chitin deacetylase (PgdA/CDA1 family)
MDRLVSVNFVAPLRRMFAGHESAARIPILMYHAITDDPEPGVRGYYRLNTPPALFHEHLRLLKAEGFQVIDLPAAARLLVGRVAPRAPGFADHQSCLPKLETRNPQPEARHAVITFDDGFQDFLTAAWPALREFGFSSTVFLPTAFIGRDRRSFKDRPCLTWAEVRRLRREGVCFGSHTVHHPKLWELAAGELERELQDSKHTLEQELNEPVQTFAHPYAFPRSPAYVTRFRAALATAGYHAGVTTSLGCAAPGDDLLTLKRLPANGADDPALFRAKLRGAYDWLAAPQALIKRLKRLRVP